MSAASVPGAGQRLLVMAPHPDDEVLGTGGLLLLASRAGAEVRVLLLTPGDNNPWPQRLMERRWSVGEDDARRWGERRVGECALALRRLGLDPAAVLRPVGWRDSELRTMLMHDAEAMVSRVARELAAFAPTHLALPCADDRHPDHNCCAVLAALALARSGPQARTLAYVVHGKVRAAPDVVLRLDEEQRRTKLEALRAHATQLALSRGRFEALVRGEEPYFADPFADTARAAPDVRVRGAGDVSTVEVEPIRPPVWRLRRPRLELVWEDGAGVLHARVLKLGRRMPDDMEWRRRGRVLGVTLATPGGVRRLYIKIATGLHGLWIYDQAGWRRARVLG